MCWNLFRSSKSYQNLGICGFTSGVHTNMIAAKQTLVLVAMICPKVVPRHSVIGLNEIGKRAHCIPPITQLPIGKHRFSIKTSTETTSTAMKLPVPKSAVYSPSANHLILCSSMTPSTECLTSKRKTLTTTLWKYHACEVLDKTFKTSQCKLIWCLHSTLVNMRTGQDRWSTFVQNWLYIKMWLQDWSVGTSTLHR